jgi:transcriptional regulator with XRE-family HTH domain
MPHSPRPLPNVRFNDFLDELVEQGATQQEVARKLRVSAAYLSDCKKGRRSITELFARRLEHAYGRHHGWFLGGERPSIFGMIRTPEHADRVVLPVFPRPIEGEPFADSRWAGFHIELCGVAAARALESLWPYILRLNHDDQRGRLQKGDLILVSQKPESRAEIQIVKHGHKMLLARPRVPSGWESLSKKRIGAGDVEIVGHCVAVVWAAL